MSNENDRIDGGDIEDHPVLQTVPLVGGPFGGTRHTLHSAFGIGMFPSVIALPINGPGSDLAHYRLDEVTEVYHFTKTEPPRHG